MQNAISLLGFLKAIFRVAICCLAGALALAPEIAGAITPWTLLINTNNVINVTNYGAVGDGVTTNTAAIQNAINAAAAGGTTNSLSGGTVEIPAGIYMCGPLIMRSAVNLQIDAGAILRMLPLGQYPGGTVNPSNFISATSLHDIEISGSGSIDGQGAPWWPYAYTNGANRPIMIRLDGCNRELIQNVTLSNSPEFHISISGGSAANTTVQGVTIRAPSSEDPVTPSHNTDACDVSGTNILVQNCNISVGDDNFTCGGGTAYVLLTNNTYGNGHGISIGSYTQGVSNIMVVNCTMNGTDNGIRIKSDNDRGGIVQNISYFNISMTNVDFPIQIYAYYNEVGTPSGISPAIAAGEPVPGTVVNTTPVYRNITFSNITATSVAGYPIGIIWARTELPATNIFFKKVSITGDRNFCVYNVSNAVFQDCQFNTSANTNTFALFNAQVVITNSAPTNLDFTFDGLTTNGYNNSLSFYNALGSLQNTNALDIGPLSLAASTLIVSNNLAMASPAMFDYQLGSNAATVVAKGNLSLGGTINITAGPGFTNGTYTLLTYGGSLSGSIPSLASAPTNFAYMFNTNTAGQVNLVVSTGSLLPPASLAATATNALVTLNWSSVSNATGYNLKRSTISGGSYVTIAGNYAGTNYSDAQVTNGTTYYYVVSSTNALVESGNSAQVSATPQSSQTNAAVVVSNVFTDVFGSSTLNSASPASPSSNSTSYEILSSKSWSPSPSILAGNLKFGIAATTSGSVELQGLFRNSPVALSNAGDSISLTVTFTNTSGLLTQSESMGFGLYHSGQNFPVPGGLNSTATTSSTGNATGNAQTWAGYVGQLSYTGSASQIMTRSAQTGTANNNQDAVTTGSGSSSYNNPGAATVGTASTTPSVTLVAGNAYTEVFSITLIGTNVLGITNSFYSGTDTNGALLSQFGAVASGSTYLTQSFDALAIGWRATANTSPTTIDISKISVNTTTAAAQAQVSLTPPNLVFRELSNQLLLSWPSNHLGWRLLAQTNPLGVGLGNNWSTVPNSTNIVSTNIPIGASNGSVFFRLVYP